MQTRRIQLLDDMPNVAAFALSLCLLLPGMSFGAGPPPVITVQPLSQTVLQNDSVTFLVVASSGTTLSYQWLKNGANISGATLNSYTIASGQATDQAVYAVKVTNAGGTVTSSNATLTVLTPPAITTQPLSQTVSMGSVVSLSVVASGMYPLRYQWNFNGIALANTTNATLMLSNIQTNQAGSYAVVVTNLLGSATSSIATLTVYIPPTITTPPQSQAVTVGQSASFFVVVNGTSPFTYQWYLNGASLGASGRSSTYTDSNVGTGDAGTYTVVVVNPIGSVTSPAATLTVYVPPSISTQPSSTVVVQGQTASFSVGVNGSSPFSYQWNLNGMNLSDGTNATLTLTNVQATQAGNVFVVITNMGGSIVSSVRTLTVNVPAAITNQPQSLTVTQGQTAVFSVGALGTATVRYQWYRNGLSLGSGSGGQTATLTLNNAGTNHAGDYTVVVYNSYGSVTSSNVTLTVLVPAQIATQPLSQAVTLGQNASFSVGAFGDAPLNYQWSFNGAALSGATDATLALTNVQKDQAGNYTVLVINNWGSVTSTNATLTVNVPPGIQTQPQSQVVVQGQDASFSVMASGTAPLKYQWRFNGVNLSGATSSILTCLNVQTNNAGSYTVVVTNVADVVTSAVATLTVLVPPFITTQPVSQTATQGLGATFSVVANGTAPMSYQWNVNGTDLTGATNATLVITNVQFIQAGSYFVTVTNPWGSVVSAPASLMVVVPPGSDLPVMQDLVAHLTFDGGLGDSSGRGNHAAAVGAPNLTPGFIGTGGFNPFRWNGTNNYATFGRPSDLRFGKDIDFTIAFWARLPAGGWTGMTADPAFISNKDWSSGDNVGWVLATASNGRLQWNYTETGNNPTKDYDGPASSFGNPIWHHVAVTFQRGGNAITYFDGVRVNSKSIAPGGTLTPKSIDTSLPINVGNDGTGDYAYGYWINGLENMTDGLNMDDVGIWRRVLRDEEICAIYNAGLAGQDLGTVTSNQFTLVTLPRITAQPVSLQVDAGSNATFSATANGTAPLGYQWFGNGALLSGRTTASLTLSNVQPAQAGGYFVVITNAAGTITSVVATLTVAAPSIALSLPAGAGMTPGGFAFEFSVPTGYTYVILASTNLQHWTPIYTNVALGGSVIFTDAAAANYSKQFYQVMVR